MYIKKSTYKELYESFNVLTDLELQVVKLYYGFNCPSITQKQIAELTGFGQPYIFYLLNKSKMKIKKHLENIENGKNLSEETKTLRKKNKYI